LIHCLLLLMLQLWLCYNLSINHAILCLFFYAFLLFFFPVYFSGKVSMDISSGCQVDRFIKAAIGIHKSVFNFKNSLWFLRISIILCHPLVLVIFYHFPWSLL
jgi:hypothetical protein